MQTPRRTRSSVLGKRSHQERADDSPATSSQEKTADEAEMLPTPESTPKLKRPRTFTLDDGRGNKENIPPFRSESLNEMTPTRQRSLRRTISHTPRSLTTTPRKRTASMLPVTPSTALSGLNLTTPPITPPQFLPLTTRTRALLRPTCNSTAQISGRSKEREEIVKFFTSFITGTDAPEQAATLYISGLPGTGKTALVNDVIRGMELDTARVVMINCMALKDVESLWDRLQEELGDSAKPKGRGRPKKLKGREAVEQTLSASTTKCIVILDELDHIAKAAQSLSPLFTLAHEHSSAIRFVGIANTHTLTASTSALGDCVGVQVLHFNPYASVQLQEILQLRLLPLAEGEVDAAAMKRFLPTPAVMLLTKKIASQTGDVRAVFEVLRGAIDLAVTAAKQSEDKDADPVVTAAHVIAAHKAYTPASTAPRTLTRTKSAPAIAFSSSSASETVTKVRGLGFQARVVLLVVALAVKRVEAGLSLTGGAAVKPAIKRANSLDSQVPVVIDSAQLHTYYSAALSRSEADAISAVSRSEFADLLGMLETVGLVTLSSSAAGNASPTKPGRKPMGRSASFAGAGKGKTAGAGARAQEVRLAEGVRFDEMLRGLGVQAAPADTGDIREEEVRAVWAREQTRIAREAKAASATTADDIFLDATAD